MQLDVAALQFISKDGWRCLGALEVGAKSYEYVPKEVVARLAKLRNQGIREILGNLMHQDLVAYERSKAYEGYRLTWKGYDFLAVNALMSRGLIDAVGPRIGVGKEADVHVVSLKGHAMALKLHRLGRTSFRSVKQRRGYLKPGQAKQSWMHLSRLSAKREFEYLKALGAAGMPVPDAIDSNRHIVLMTFIDGVLLNKVRHLDDPADTIQRLWGLLVQMLQAGVVHGDFNEFNLIYSESTGDITVIDFPQIVSVAHENAEELFDRDVESIKQLFARRFDYIVEEVPKFHDTVTQEMIDDCKERKNGIIQLNECEDLQRILANAQEDSGASTDSDGEGDDGSVEEEEKEEKKLASEVDSGERTDEE